MSRCVRCDHDTTMSRGRTASGGWQVFWYCFRCKKRNGAESIPHRKVPSIQALPIAWDNTDLAQRGPCDTCFRVRPLHYHHVAPRHLFGDEAELWPGIMLCETCHQRWHRMVTPLMSQPTAVGQILDALPANSPVAAALRKAEEEIAEAKARKITPEMSAKWRARKAAAKREEAA